MVFWFSWLPKQIPAVGMLALIKPYPSSAPTPFTSSKIPSQAACCQVQGNRYAWGILASKQRSHRDLGQTAESNMSGKQLNNSKRLHSIWYQTVWLCLMVARFCRLYYWSLSGFFIFWGCIPPSSAYFWLTVRSFIINLHCIQLQLGNGNIRGCACLSMHLQSWSHRCNQFQLE